MFTETPHLIEPYQVDILISCLNSSPRGTPRRISPRRPCSLATEMFAPSVLVVIGDGTAGSRIILLRSCLCSALQRPVAEPSGALLPCVFQYGPNMGLIWAPHSMIQCVRTMERGTCKAPLASRAFRLGLLRASAGVRGLLRARRSDWAGRGPWRRAAACSWRGQPPPSHRSLLRDRECVDSKGA